MGTLLLDRIIRGLFRRWHLNRGKDEVKEQIVQVSGKTGCQEEAAGTKALGTAGIHWACLGDMWRPVWPVWSKAGGNDERRSRGICRGTSSVRSACFQRCNKDVAIKTALKDTQWFLWSL